MPRVHSFSKWSFSWANLRTRIFLSKSAAQSTTPTSKCREQNPAILPHTGSCSRSTTDRYRLHSVVIPNLRQGIYNSFISLSTRTPGPPNHTSSLECAMYISHKEKIYNSNFLLNESITVFSKKDWLSFWSILSLCAWNNQSASWFAPRLLSPLPGRSVCWCHLAVSIHQTEGLTASASLHSGRLRISLTLPYPSCSHFSTHCSPSWDSFVAFSPQPALDQSQDQSRDGKDFNFRKPNDWMRESG